jgi:hypothetical protein
MMSQRMQMIFIFAALALVMSCVLWRMNRALPILTKTETDVDNTIIGDSATSDQGDGPAYMAANWHWPQPLAFWNPVATVN